MISIDCHNCGGEIGKVSGNSLLDGFLGIHPKTYEQETQELRKKLNRVCPKCNHQLFDKVRRKRDWA